MINSLLKYTALMIAVAGTLAGSSSRVRADLRVLPLGDSNTVGFHELPNGSYRYFLEQHFTGNGIPYDFVGSKFSGSASLYDKNHEGWDGFRVEQLAAEMVASNTISMFQPDVVLLLIGTNNRGTPLDYGVYKGWYDSLFDAIGNVPVVAATVPRVGPWIYQNPSGANEVNNKRIPLMNQVMSDIAAEPGRENITIVDYYSVLDPNTHLLSDGIHFNTAGHQLLANLFLQGMSVAVPEPSQVLMMLIPVAGLIAVRGKRWWTARRTGD
jgi:lysophospholipase L1-like esterase